MAASIAALCAVPTASFGQSEPAVPPAVDAAPDAGTGDPGAPEDRPPPRIIPDVLPPREFGPGMGGRDCEHERSPGIGV